MKFASKGKEKIMGSRDGNLSAQFFATGLDISALADYLWQAIEYFQEYPSLPILCVFGATYLAYYLLYVGKKPQLVCGDEKLLKFITKHCPILHEKFWPTFWCFEARAQTIVRTILKSSPHIPYQSEILKTRDGGRIQIDWLENQNPDHPDPAKRPTVILLPGLTGNSRETYALHIVQQSSILGYRSVVFNYRGTSANEDKLLTPRTYCATDTEDLETVVNHVKNCYPEAPLFGVGISLGGMIMTGYLAKCGENAVFQAAMAVSAAWDSFESSKTLEQPINYLLFNKYLARNLVNLVHKNIELFEHHFDMDYVMKSQTIKEFDDRFTAKLFGYGTWEKYYRDACLNDKLHLIKIPLLCLNAADDPFSPYHAIPVAQAKENKNVAFVITSHGGHIGFMEGIFPRHANYMDRLFVQFADAVFKHAHTELKTD
ncbi:Hypothetical predicted protein [Octopus vulgaris]|uniref:Phospholipase ABHD3 n=1 Tax=Octopus vulgaris TaxID=6645 RepID=A0AA36BRF3_OCTVU|nr:Hypothetical predicted protein [Octopus vulgaris]